MTDLEELDEWIVGRLEKVSYKACKHVIGGGNLNAPNYRTALGKHQAYMAVRSYIRGMKKQRGSHD